MCQNPGVDAAAVILCRCCDVTLADVQAAVAAGYTHPETIKRRTKALTGPCQGRACEDLVLAAIGVAPDAAPRARPPGTPVRLGDLAGGPPVDPIS